MFLQACNDIDLLHSIINKLTEEFANYIGTKQLLEMYFHDAVEFKKRFSRALDEKCLF